MCDAAGEKENTTLKCHQQNRYEEIFKRPVKRWGNLFGSVPWGSGLCPKKAEFKSQQVPQRVAGEKGPILGKTMKNILCVWPRRLGEDVMPVYKYSGNVNTREGSNLI